MSEDKRYQLLVSFRRGGKTEFLNAMRLALRTFGRRIENGSSAWAFHPTSGGFGYREVVAGELFDQVETPSSLQTWGVALRDLFGPTWNEALTREHPCARDQHSHSGSHYLVWADQVTIHEQLEARHQLLDWLDERERQSELDGGTLARLRATLR